MIFGSWGCSWAILVPRGCPKCSKTAPEVDFLSIWDHFGTILGSILDQLVTTCWPLLGNSVVAWWPIDELMTTCWPLSDQFVAAWWPLGDHFGINWWLLGGHSEIQGLLTTCAFLTTYQPPTQISALGYLVGRLVTNWWVDGHLVTTDGSLSCHLVTTWTVIA